MRWMYDTCKEVNLHTKDILEDIKFLKFDYFIRTPVKTDKGGADE